MTPEDSAGGRGESRAGRLAALALVLLPIFVFRDALVGRRVFFTQDVTAYIEPKTSEILRAAADRRFPFWSADVALGAPFFAEIDNAVLNPWNVLALLGPRRWIEVAVPLWCALAALGLFALLREWALSRAAAVLGGLAFGLSGLLVFYFDNSPYLNSAAYLPWVLLCWHRSLARRAWSWLAAAAVLLALMLFSGDVQTVYDTALLAALYGFIVPDLRRPLVTPVTRYLALGLLALALGAVQIVPTVELLGVAPRLLTLDAAYEPSFHPRRFLELVLPFAYGKDLPGSPYWGQFLHTPISPRPWTRAVYVGVLPLVALGFAFAERRTRPLALLSTLVGGVALTASVGPALPVYAFLYRYLPLFDRFRSPAKLWVLGTLALAVLGALGAERLARGSRRATWVGMALALVLCGSGIAVRLAPLAAVRAATIDGPAMHLAVVAAALAAVLALGPRLGATRAGILFALVHAADLTRVSGAVAEFFGDRRVVPDSVTAVRLMRGDAAASGAVPIRLFHHPALLDGRGYVPPPGLNPWEQAKLWNRLSLDYNHAWTFGLADVFAYSVLQDDRPARLRLRLRQDERALAPTLARLGVRYLLLPLGMDPPPGTRLLADLEGGALRVAAVEATAPRVFLAPLARTVLFPDLALEGLVHPAFDPRRLALVEGPIGDLSSALEDAVSPPGRVTVASSAPGFLEADLEVAEPRYLVFNEAWYPGWTATVDGEPRAILRANYLMQCLSVGPGDRRVEFRYRPTGFDRALLVSLGAWGVAIAVVARPAVRRRKRP